MDASGCREPCSQAGHVACPYVCPPVLWGQHGQRIMHPVLAEWGDLAVADAGTSIVLVAPQCLSYLLWRERCATLGASILLLPSLQPVQSACGGSSSSVSSTMNTG